MRGGSEGGTDVLRPHAERKNNHEQEGKILRMKKKGERKWGGKTNSDRKQRRSRR